MRPLLSIIWGAIIYEISFIDVVSSARFTPMRKRWGRISRPLGNPMRSQRKTEFVSGATAGAASGAAAGTALAFAVRDEEPDKVLVTTRADVANNKWVSNARKSGGSRCASFQARATRFCNEPRPAGFTPWCFPFDC